MLSEGAFPVRDTTDILMALARAGADVQIPPDEEKGGKEAAPMPVGAEAIYEVLSPDPASLDALARLTGLDFATLCGGLERLAQARLARAVGGWWQRT